MYIASSLEDGGCLPKQRKGSGSDLWRTSICRLETSGNEVDDSWYRLRHLAEIHLGNTHEKLMGENFSRDAAHFFSSCTESAADDIMEQSATAPAAPAGAAN